MKILFSLLLFVSSIFTSTGSTVLTFEIPACEVTNSLENIKKSNLEVYPNPTDGIFYIISENYFSGKVNVEIFNLTGQQVFTRAFNLMSDINSLTVDVKELATGIYFLSINHKEYTINKKLIIR